VARSTPFTRLFVHTVEELHDLSQYETYSMLENIMPDIRRLASMILADERFAEELPKEFRERLQFVVMS
jgi:hypothetical protein